eukprot:748201-Hanusia_phi.AAC.3
MADYCLLACLVVSARLSGCQVVSHLTSSVSHPRLPSACPMLRAHTDQLLCLVLVLPSLLVQLAAACQPSPCTLLLVSQLYKKTGAPTRSVLSILQLTVKGKLWVGWPSSDKLVGGGTNIKVQSEDDCDPPDGPRTGTVVWSSGSYLRNKYPKMQLDPVVTHHRGQGPLDWVGGYKGLWGVPSAGKMPHARGTVAEGAVYRF